MIFKYQKIILTLELIAVVAVTIYSGTSTPVALVTETEAESVEKTVKESKRETAKTEETKKKDKKSETKAELETVKKVADNKEKSEKKGNTSSGNTTNASGNKTNDNSSAQASGTTSKPMNNSTSTQSSGNNNSHPAGNGSSTSAPSSSSAPTTPVPATPALTTPQTEHTHNWVEQTHTVHHDATGHYEEVVVQEAWDEPVYGMVEKHICADCGEINSSENPNVHILENGHSNWWSEWRTEQTGTNHHDEETESQWVEDSPAWDETVSDGYVCDVCGATK